MYGFAEKVHSSRPPDLVRDVEHEQRVGGHAGLLEPLGLHLGPREAVEHPAVRALALRAVLASAADLPRP